MCVCVCVRVYVCVCLFVFCFFFNKVVLLGHIYNFYVNNLVGDVKTNPRDVYRYINSQKKDNQGIPPHKRRGGTGITASEIEQAEEFNGQFMDVFNKK